MKKIYRLYVITTMLMLLAVITPNRTVFALTSSSVIKEGENDINPIPDKYNTGAKEPEGGFQVVGVGGSFTCTRDGKNTSLTFLVSGGNTNVFNLAYKNSNMKGTYVIENTDFSSTPIKIFGEDTWDNIAQNNNYQMKFIFRNCKFQSFSTGKYECQKISYEFENCSFENLYGSNLTVNRCYFGGGYNDRANLFTCTYINYCYFANPTNYISTDDIVHIDGVQIFGDNTNHIDIHDIYFDHCRFEIPTCKYPNAPNAAVNTCIMLQLEYSSGYNMGFTNCIINGGGFSVYAHTKYDYLTLNNVVFKNISYGGGRNWKPLYPDQSASINFNMNTWKETDGLYVGSVWQDTSSTSISITNDTRAERKFIIYSSSGKRYEYTIKACPEGLQMKNYSFEDLPFDVVYSIPEKASWIAVYEVKKNASTGKLSYEQIRYHSFSTLADSTAQTQTTLISYLSADTSGELHIQSYETPAKTKITKAKGKKKGFTVKWKKVSGDIDGYQVQFSTSKKFTSKKTNTIKVKGSTKTSYKRQKLKAKKHYYIRIRTYNTIEINGKKQKIYGEWSKTKKIKTK